MPNCSKIIELVDHALQIAAIAPIEHAVLEEIRPPLSFPNPRAHTSRRSMAKSPTTPDDRAPSSDLARRIVRAVAVAESLRKNLVEDGVGDPLGHLDAADFAGGASTLECTAGRTAPSTLTVATVGSTCAALDESPSCALSVGPQPDAAIAATATVQPSYVDRLHKSNIFLIPSLKFLQRKQHQLATTASSGRADRSDPSIKIASEPGSGTAPSEPAPVPSR